MGKRIIQQRRGRGSKTYTSPSHRYKGAAKHATHQEEGVVIDLVNCPGHSAPLMVVSHLDGDMSLTLATNGIKVGDTINSTSNNSLNKGDVKELKDIPEGTLIYNIEARPGDGGKFVRTSGAFAKVVANLIRGLKLSYLPRKRSIFC